MMLQWLESLGVDPGSLPDPAQARSVMMAAGLVAAAWIVGWIVSRTIGARLQEAALLRYSRLVGGVGPRLAATLGAFATIALLWALASSRLGIGLAAPLVAVALALTTARLARSVARGLHVSSTTAFGIAAVVFTLVLSGALGGLAPLQAALDGAALRFGERRISLLDIVQGLVVGILVLAGARLLVRLINRWVGGLSSLDAAQQVLVQKLAGIAVIVAALFLAIDLLGLDLTALTVFSGAFGLAIGFGLQKTFGNLIAGLLLLMDRSLKPGDVIVVGDTFGWVNKIGVRAVSVLTRDGKEHLIPNELLMTERVENWSYSSREVRVHIPVGVAYASDLEQVERLLLDAALDTPRVLRKPPPVCWLSGFGDSSVDFDLIVWIDDPEQGVGNVRSDVLKRVWRLFQSNQIEIPFPQRDVRLRS